MSQITESQYRSYVLAVVKHELGVHEDPMGSNSGAEVNAFLASVRLPPGNPWCMAFVYWCLRKVQLGYAGVCPATGIAPRILQTGSCTAQFHDAEQRKTLVKAASVCDIFLLPDSHRPGHFEHTGFVISPQKNLPSPTIEGNSNTNGSSEGTTVVGHQRNLNSLAIVNIWGNPA